MLFFLAFVTAKVWDLSSLLTWQVCVFCIGRYTGYNSNPIPAKTHSRYSTLCGANHPIPSEQGNPHGRRPDTVIFDKVKEASGDQRSITQSCANHPSPGIARESTRVIAWYSQNLTKSSELSPTSHVKRYLGRPRGQKNYLMTNT